MINLKKKIVTRHNGWMLVKVMEFVQPDAVERLISYASEVASPSWDKTNAGINLATQVIEFPSGLKLEVVLESEHTFEVRTASHNWESDSLAPDVTSGTSQTTERWKGFHIKYMGHRNVKMGCYCNIPDVFPIEVFTNSADAECFVRKYN